MSAPELDRLTQIEAQIAQLAARQQSTDITIDTFARRFDRLDAVTAEILRKTQASDALLDGLQTMLVAHGKRLADQGRVLAEILTRLDNHDRGLQQVLARLPQPPGGAS